jgi:hypothetical protein
VVNGWERFAALTSSVLIAMFVSMNSAFACNPGRTNDNFYHYSGYTQSTSTTTGGAYGELQFRAPYQINTCPTDLSSTPHYTEDYVKVFSGSSFVSWGWHLYPPCSGQAGQSWDSWAHYTCSSGTCINLQPGPNGPSGTLLYYGMDHSVSGCTGSNQWALKRGGNFVVCVTSSSFSPTAISISGAITTAANQIPGDTTTNNVFQDVHYYNSSLGSWQTFSGSPDVSDVWAGGNSNGSFYYIFDTQCSS